MDDEGSRVGNDPKKSVVDRHHRSHDVAHRYVRAGSSLVTTGRGHPTITIRAPARRNEI